MQSYIKNLLDGIDLLTMPAWIKEIKYSSPCRMVAMSANRTKPQQPRRRRSMLYIYIHFNFDDMMKKAPNARMAHPWPDHFYPLHVALGAAGERAKAELILLFYFFSSCVVCSGVRYWTVTICLLASGVVICF